MTDVWRCLTCGATITATATTEIWHHTNSDAAYHVPTSIPCGPLERTTSRSADAIRCAEGYRDHSEPGTTNND